MLVLSDPVQPIKMLRNAILNNGIVEVTGSIPVGSTKFTKGLAGNG